MKKRVLALLLSLSMGIMMLTGCQSTQDKDQENTPAAEDVTDGTESDTDAADTTENDAENTDISDTQETVIDVAALEAQEGFKVEGTKLLDANGNEFVMRGVNQAYTWFASKNTQALEEIAKTGANCVRIVLSDGAQWTMTPADTVTDIIEKCKELKMICILEVHDATGYDDQESLELAANYFTFIKEALIGQEDYVIINIANEWMGSSRSTGWTTGYTTVIPWLREAGLAHTIMVDSAGWGQYAKCIKEGGEEVLASDVLGNTMFSIHMYGTAGADDTTIERNIKYATDRNLCVCIGEFGYTHSDGDVDEAFLMSYCVENSIGYMGWSWCGNGGGVEYLDLSEDWTIDHLSEDWGEVLVYGENGISETSVTCTIFE